MINHVILYDKLLSRTPPPPPYVSYIPLKSLRNIFVVNDALIPIPRTFFFFITTTLACPLSLETYETGYYDMCCIGFHFSVALPSGRKHRPEIVPPRVTITSAFVVHFITSRFPV